MTRSHEPNIRELKKMLRETREARKLIPAYSLKLKEDFVKGKITREQYENARKVGMKGKDFHEWIVYYTRKIRSLEKLIEERRKRKHLIRLS